ncbi:hypothetical protein EGW08_022101, partial [Elysia chlorotica]
QKFFEIRHDLLKHRQERFFVCSEEGMDNISNFTQNIRVFFILKQIMFWPHLSKRREVLWQHGLLWLYLDSFEQVGTDVVSPHGGHVLLSADLGTLQQDTVVEVEFEQWHHDFDDILRVLSESFLELSGVADQHLARRRLLLQARRADPKVLLGHTKIKKKGNHLVIHSLVKTCRLTVHEGHLWLQRGSFQHGTHHQRQVLGEIFAQNLTHPRPSRNHVEPDSHLWVVVCHVVLVGLRLKQQLHDLVAVLHELFLADRQPDQTDALDGLASQQAVRRVHNVLHDVLQLRHKS